MENLNELYTALAKAQGQNCPHEESKVLKKHAQLLNPSISSCHKDIVNKFYSKIIFGLSDCWYWCGAHDSAGYGSSRPYKGKSKAHCISWILHNGEYPKSMKVLHKCDVRNCVNPDHLFLGTQKDNVHDMINKGRQNFKGAQFRSGINNHKSVLSEKSVLEMRALYNETDISYKSIAKMYDVSTMTAYRAITKQSWREV